MANKRVTPDTKTRAKSTAKARPGPIAKGRARTTDRSSFSAVRLPDIHLSDLLPPDLAEDVLIEVAPPPHRRLERHPDLKPSHPGALLREIVPATGHSKTKIAQLLGVSRQTLYDVLAETAAVTPNLALRLGRMFGDGPEPWLRMQATHDVWTLSRAIAGELEAIPRLAAAE